MSKIDAYSFNFDNMYPYNVVKKITYKNDRNVDLEMFAERLNKLPDREKDIIEARFRDGYTLEAVAKRHRLTRERVRQLQESALAKMRYNPNEYFLVSRSDLREMRDENNKLRATLNSLNDKMLKLKDAFSEVVDGAVHESRQCDDLSVDEMGLSVRTHNCMARAGKRTASEMAAMTNREIELTRNLGKKSANELYSKLVELGYEPNWSNSFLLG